MKLTNRRSRPVFAAVGVVTAVICLALAAAAEPGYDVKPKQAPALPDKGWLNTPGNKPLKLDELRGKVVLVEFWTFACFNCRNTLPYVKAWHEKYAKQGLVVIGVHSPEFDFERKPENVQNSLRELGITYPVVLDNDFTTWNRYQNRYWPTFYLIDAAGQIVYTAVGEGDYDRTERKIQQLLAQTRIGWVPAEGKTRNSLKTRKWRRKP